MSLSEQIRNRLPRIVSNIVAVLLLVLLNFVILPILPLAEVTVPGFGYTLGGVVQTVILVAAVFLMAKILSDLAVVVDTATSLLVRRLPGMSKERSALGRALRDFTWALAVLLLGAAVLPPLYTFIGRFGAVTATAASVMITGVIFLLLFALIYDASRAIYTATGRKISSWVDMLAQRAEEEEERLKESATAR